MLVIGLGIGRSINLLPSGSMHTSDHDNSYAGQAMNTTENSSAIHTAYQGNLPLQRHKLIGREEEIEMIASYLDDEG